MRDLSISDSEAGLPHTGLRIGQLAEMLGTTTKTIRFYESIGLLTAALRGESGYRLYDQAAVDRARLVVGLRRLDLSIHELQALLTESREMTLRQRLLALMDEKLRDNYLELSVLQGRCEDLSARHAALLATPREHAPQCICGALLRPCACANRPAPDAGKSSVARTATGRRK